MKAGPNPQSREQHVPFWPLVLLLAGGFAATSCDRSPRVQESDIEAVRDVYQTGLEASDPYVRAETLRIMEVLGRRDLPGRVRDLLKDDHPMVRVAALRVLHATDHPDAASFTLTRFTEGEADEKRAILEAVLEHGPEKFQRRLLWRSLRTTQPRRLRRMAVERGLESWAKRARERGNEATFRRQLAANAEKYVRQLDPVVGGSILAMFIDLGREDAARPALEALSESNGSLDERLRAADVLLEARARSAVPAFRELLETARSQGEGARLEVPEQGLDSRLVRRAVLGVTAQGDEDLVSKAKSYLDGASPEVYIEVLRGLQPNAAEGAQFALENAMTDARPRVRRRAIELYGMRDDAEVSALFDVALDRTFAERGRQTRRAVARVLGEHFAADWVDHLESKLDHSDRRRGALRLLVQVLEETDQTAAVGRVRESLVEIATSGEGRAAALAAYLLIELPEAPESGEVTSQIETLRDPMPRYGLLHHISERNPSERIGYLLENFYPGGDDLESFSVRLISGAGLWIARHSYANREE